MSSSITWRIAYAQGTIDFETFKWAANNLPLTDECFFPTRGKIEK